MLTAASISVRRLALAVAVVAVVAACSHADRGPPPSELADGSAARVLGIGFEGVDVPVIATRARALTATRLPCGEEGKPGLVERGVERVGVRGTSVTTVSPDGRTARGCDGTRVDDWCGQAFGRLHPERAVEPRLSLTCSGGGDATVGFAWVEPGPGAAYVVVTHDRYAEAYGVLDSVPVRVATEQVDVESSSARFEVTEHAESGRRLRRYVLQPRVAG